MPVYYIDANYFLRFILKDNLNQWKIANGYFEKAKQEKIKLAQGLIPGAEQFATGRAKTAEEQFQQELSAGTAAIHQKFQPLFTGVEEAGKKQREAQQSIFSFSGFGRSTDAATKAGEIEATTSSALQKLEAARQAETAALRASLMGEKASTVNALNANVDKLKLEAKTFETEALARIQDLNAKSQVSGIEAINNIMQVLGKTSPAKVEGFDQDLTKTINDGFLYKVNAKGVPERIIGTDNKPIRAGVNDTEKSDVQVSLPSVDMFGNSKPGFIYDKKTGSLKKIDPDTGEQTVFQSGPGAQETINTMSNWDEYVKNTGTGQVISGSPYHKGLEVDIDGKIGDPLLSFSGGRVVSVENTCRPDNPKCGGGLGNSVVIEDKNGNRTTYAHLNNTDVKVGSMINPGGLLGGIGNTGQTIPGLGGDGSHVHIDVKDRAGNSIPVSQLTTSSGFNTISRPTGTQKPMQQLMAEALQKGYTSKDEMAGYANAAKIGINLPNKSELAAPSDTQRLSAGFASRLKQSQDIFDQLAGDITKVDPLTFLGYRNVPSAFGIGNALKPEWFKKMEQAERNFINANLRRESGSAIAPSEFENARLQYFPQPFDEPSIIEQKKKNRELVIESMKFASGGVASQRFLTDMSQQGDRTIMPSPLSQSFQGGGQGEQAIVSTDQDLFSQLSPAQQAELRALGLTP